MAIALGESHGHDIVLVGASAGGVDALTTLVKGLPPELPAAVFIVLHVSADSPSLLPDILSRNTKLVVKQAQEHEAIHPGTVYVAVPDHHLLVDRGSVRVVHGPKENLHRPAIDPLFRSAALAYGTRCIGVVLTGALDDGTVGMASLKRRGGVTIVQDPRDAIYPSMPLKVLQNVKVDYQVPLKEIPRLIISLASEPARQEEECPMSDELNTESRLGQRERAGTDAIPSLQKSGKVSTLTCPECHGALWELTDPDVLRFRCHVGHDYSADSLVSGQDNTLELALWSALRALEEQQLLAQRSMQRAKDRNFAKAAALFECRAAEAERQADIIRRFLLNRHEEALD